jgi:serine protease AprX
MRHERPTTQGERSSALWGRGGRETRSSALWGRGGRSTVALFALVVSVIIPAAGIASSGSGDRGAVVPAELLAAATANPDATFDVVVQGDKSHRSPDIAKDVNENGGSLKRAFRSISGVSATVTGKQLLNLADDSHVTAITRNEELSLTTYETAEMWRAATKVSKLYGGPQTPAIAIVDSGIDSTRLDFGGRVRASVNFSSLAPNATGDQLGHGTMVASLAAGAGTPLVGTYKGAAPTSPLIDVRVTDGEGHALTSDIIAAIDWIIANKSTYNIRVANFSLAGRSATSILFDPLNKAVERLWLSGVTVVAAAGNNGSADSSVEIASPANDPFVITVGATGINKTTDTSDDTRAPWSAHGHTADGFHKPDLAAPGRWMVGAVPTGSLLSLNFSLRSMLGGYLWMSGTSFSAPVVAGAAAQILARRPDFGPDQVKGALMVSAAYLPSQGASLGAGTIDAAAAAAVTSPPNPNENLHAFVSEGEFDARKWLEHVSTNSNWTASNWTVSNWVSSNWVSSNWVASNWVASNWTLSNWTASNWTMSNWVLSNWVLSNWTVSSGIE